MLPVLLVSILSIQVSLDSALPSVQRVQVAKFQAILSTAATTVVLENIVILRRLFARRALSVLTVQLLLRKVHALAVRLVGTVLILSHPVSTVPQDKCKQHPANPLEQPQKSVRTVQVGSILLLRRSPTLVLPNVSPVYVASLRIMQIATPAVPRHTLASTAQKGRITVRTNRQHVLIAQ